jgi:hypothetical protein
MAKQTDNGGAVINANGSPSASPVTATATAITITRHSRMYRNGRTGICMSMPKDIAELLAFKPGDTLLVTAYKDGKGWCRLDKADSVG